MTREERENQWEKVEQAIDKLNDKSDLLRPDPKLDELVREYDRLDHAFNQRGLKL
jgi:uncharacterized protein YjgD (DUF1641 family)